MDYLFGPRLINCKWVYNDKYRSRCSLEKNNVRIVAKGFAKKEGIDYEDIISHTTKWDTIHTLLSLTAHNGWKVHQMDVNIIFLNGYLKENLFTHQP